MEYKINEQKIIGYAKRQLPDIDSCNKKIIVVYVNDFCGEENNVNKYYEIMLSDDKTILQDRKEKDHYYIVAFKKSIGADNESYWDLIGYSKKQFINI